MAVSSAGVLVALALDALAESSAHRSQGSDVDVMIIIIIAVVVMMIIIVIVIDECKSSSRPLAVLPFD